MGIDIYAEWRGQSGESKSEQSAAWLSVHNGKVGYLREAYHGQPYATRYLCREAFKTGQAAIRAAVLKERLPKALELTEERERKLYKSTDEVVAEARQSLRDFVALCEAKEKETGEPVSIIASY
jgi:hypothetical protein